MSGEFEVTGGARVATEQPVYGDRRMVPMKVGSATVFVEAVSDGPKVETGDGFYPVGVNPAEAFETASEALKECVRVVGARVETIGGALRPDEVAVEFTITFDVEGQAKIIPVLLTGKAKSAMGLKVSAKWNPRERTS